MHESIKVSFDRWATQLKTSFNIFKRKFLQLTSIKVYFIKSDAANSKPAKHQLKLILSQVLHATFHEIYNNNNNNKTE